MYRKNKVDVISTQFDGKFSITVVYFLNEQFIFIFGYSRLIAVSVDVETDCRFLCEHTVAQSLVQYQSG